MEYKSGLSYECTEKDSDDCKQAKNKCCFTNNCNKPPDKDIPSTTVNSCYIGETRNGIGFLEQVNTSELSNALGQYKACGVK
jgi:hypothetical protein